MALQFSLWEISVSPCFFFDLVFSLHVPLWAGLSSVSGFSYDFFLILTMDGMREIRSLSWTFLAFCNMCPTWIAGETGEEGKKCTVEAIEREPGNVWTLAHFSIFPCAQVKIIPSSIILSPGGTRINGFNFYFWVLLCLCSPFIWIPWSSRIAWQGCISEQSEEQINNLSIIRF